MNREIDFQRFVLPVITAALVGGTVWLAVVDKDTRADFSQLVSVTVAGMLGASMPNGSRREP